MRYTPLARFLRHVGKTESHVAKKVGVKQPTISNWKKLPDLSEMARAEERKKKFLKAFPKYEAVIRAMFEGRQFDLALSDLTQLPVPSPPEDREVERAARAFVTPFRTENLLDRLAHLARTEGLRAERLDYVPYGLKALKDPAVVPSPHGDLFFPRNTGAGSGLHAGAAVILGSPNRHPLAQLILDILAPKLGVKVQFWRSPAQHRSYLGYWAVVNDLVIGDRRLVSQRSVDHDDRVRYLDHGVLLHAPAEEVVMPGQHALGEGVTNLYLVAGAHRLATGAGVRLFEDPAFRERCLARSHDLRGFGLVAYRVEAACGTWPEVVQLSHLHTWSAGEEGAPDS